MVQKPDREAEELDYPDQRAARKQQQLLDAARRQHGHPGHEGEAVDPPPKSEAGPEGLPQR
ncbi:hypothetical protein [Silvimonas iriomotensis]|uniref:Uncharacterized protein n=1 Tax=Silvimonas iriomotensis TaxID=449662 RepID=A0ABQ2P585_9NEIS|nr:hypothetical protein [Silvimonas iriomotensis]GGP18566.1 hypothetical protein GCM10010970_05700 [Silvimonas iriomotensis]